MPSSNFLSVVIQGSDKWLLQEAVKYSHIFKYTQMYKEGAVCFREIVKPGNLLNLGSELPEVMMVCNIRVMELTSADEQTIITKDPIV